MPLWPGPGGFPVLEPCVCAIQGTIFQSIGKFNLVQFVSCRWYGTGGLVEVFWYRWFSADGLAKVVW